MSNSYLGGRTAPAAILCEAMVSVAPPSVGPTSGGVLQAGRCIPVQSAVLWSRSFRRTRLGFAVDIDIIEDGRSQVRFFFFLVFLGVGCIDGREKRMAEPQAAGLALPHASQSARGSFVLGRKLRPQGPFPSQWERVYRPVARQVNVFNFTTLNGHSRHQVGGIHCGQLVSR